MQLGRNATNGTGTRPGFLTASAGHQTAIKPVQLTRDPPRTRKKRKASSKKLRGVQPVKMPPDHASRQRAP
jgi:hypothetical protein